MSDDATAETTTEQSDSDSEQLGDAGKKALAEERKARKAAEKKASEFEARLAEIEAAKLSAEEKANRRAEEFEKRATDAEIGLLRLNTAVRHGINAEDTELFLTGSDEETLNRQAEILKQRYTASKKPVSTGLKSGASGDDARMNGKEKTAAALRSLYRS